MAKAIQIRDVPEAVVSKLKARARAERMSLSAYLRRELEQLAALPPPPAPTISLDEWLENTRRLPPIRSQKSSAQIIRELRGN